MRKKEKKKNTLLLNGIKIILFLLLIVIVFLMAPNYEKNDTYDAEKINLIINNNNVTKKLKYDLFMNEKNIIYMSEPDIKNYFDEYIFFEEETKQIITTYGEKVGVLPIDKNIIKINDSEVNVLSGALVKDKIYYLPISSMSNVYNVDIDYIKEEKILILDSLCASALRIADAFSPSAIRILDFFSPSASSVDITTDGIGPETFAAKSKFLSAPFGRTPAVEENCSKVLTDSLFKISSGRQIAISTGISVFLSSLEYSLSTYSFTASNGLEKTFCISVS